jgi:hypothetical protein
MTASNMGVPARSPPEKHVQEKHVTLDGEVPSPMPQQDADRSHGHEMHPQKLVQLVGCHDSNAGKHEKAAPARSKL